MNVRRIVMMMLVLVFMVQGVSALDPIVLHASFPSGFTTGGTELDNFYYNASYFGQQTNVTYFASWGSINGSCFPLDQYVKVVANGKTSITAECDASSGAGYRGSGTLSATESFTFPSIPGGNIAVLAQAFNEGNLPYYEVVAARITAIYSFEPIYLASGESCIGSGIFDIYVEDNFAYSYETGNYSFDITNGINYSIYSTGTDEWHNFTATASDHTWNPTCTLPSISGTITALDGEGIYNLNVTLHDFYLYERDLVDSTFTDTNGSYNFYINDSDDAGPYSLGVSGYCNAGADCSAFRIEAPINPGGESYVFDYTWHIPQNIRVDLQYENGSAVPGALLNMKNLPGDVGAWKTTATDGYTTYTSMQSSKIYVDYHGGDNYSGGPAGSDALHSFQLVPNGQYRWSQFVLSIPDDYENNTTIPPILPPVDEVNKTDISNMTTDSMFVVSVNDVLGAPIPHATVTASAADKNYTGKFSGFTNTSGQWSFPKNSTVGQYDVSVSMTCFLPQTKTRFSSADFTLEYSCDAELPGQDENGTGGWKSNDSYSNWTMNGTAADEGTTKTKLSSWLYFFGGGIFFIMFLTYFTKK